MQRVPLKTLFQQHKHPLPLATSVLLLERNEFGMGRTPCCEKLGLKRGRWTAEEDEVLVRYIQANGEGGWRSVPRNAGLRRCGKSCRLRWINYLRPDLKRGNITPHEEEIIISLHSSMGNRWSLIAGHLPGRTDNEIKNYWNSHLNRKFHGFITNKNFETGVTARGGCSGGGDHKGRSVMKKSLLEHVRRAKSMQSITEHPEAIQEDLVTLDSSKVTHSSISVPKQNGYKGMTSEALCSNEESIGSVMLCPEEQETWEGLEHESTCLEELLEQNDIPRSNGSSDVGGWRCASLGNGKEFYTGAPGAVYDEWVDWPSVDNQKKLESDDDEILSWLWNDSNET